VLSSRHFFSYVGAEKWSRDKSKNSEWPDAYSQNRKNNYCYDKSDGTSCYSSFGSSEFFGSDDRNDVIQNGYQNNHSSSENQKFCAEGMSARELQKQQSDVIEQWSWKNWQDCARSSDERED
jgi:hypothetical protein